MAISERSIKLLWGRAASRCAFPNCQIKLTQDKSAASVSFPLGEQAHIVGEKEDAPRGRSVFSPDERNSYFNLILLCPTHHTIIDNNPEDYPAEKLHLIKAQHELWVEQTLSEREDLRKTAQSITYTDLVDAAVEMCHFNDWDKWAGQLMSVYRQCDIELEFKIREFAKKIFRTIWPGSLPELERALKTLSLAMTDMIDKFCEHVEVKDSKLCEDKFYKINRWDPKLYKELSREYDDWGDEIDKLVVEVTKAADWVADAVRRDINPMFFATKGKFTVTYGPMENLRTRTIMPEYTEEEKRGIPYSQKQNSRKGSKKGEKG